jgi:ribonuclease HII
LHPKVSGIDEAGRGSVFGPLFIVGVTLDLDSLDLLKKNGLKDSKLFSGLKGREKRSELALKIKKTAFETKVIEIKAVEIDRTLINRPNDNLNLLEIRYISKLLLQLTSNNITVDTLSSPKYTKNQLMFQLNKIEKTLKVETNFISNDICRFSLIKNEKSGKEVLIAKKADKIFPIVSAASCVAKYLRDQRLREIEGEYGIPHLSLGQGYPNEKDKKVMTFLKEYQDEIKNHHFPFIRYSWSWPPLQKLIRTSYKTLDGFMNDTGKNNENS